MLCTLTLGISAADLPLVYDEADILTDAEESRLLSKLETVSDKANMDVVVVTVDSIGIYSPTEYADDFYDYNGYGRGPERDGILLLISMDERDWCISACGYASTVFTDAGIDYISEQVIYYLSDGDYASAFDEFAAQCEVFAAQADASDPFDTHNLPKEPFDVGSTLIISLVIGLVIALIYTGILKGELRSVRRQNSASVYVKNGSLSITNSKDFFLYKNVIRSARQTSSSSGSSAHRSSSGTLHTGRSGKF